MIQGVAFDCFGTLIGFGVRRDPYAVFMHNRNSTEIRQTIMTREVSVSDLARQTSLEHRLSEIQARLEQEITGLYVYDDAAATLAKLRLAGVPVAVCSNLASAYGESVRQLLPGVSHFAFSYEVGAVKPDRAIYEHVCDLLKLPAPSVLFIGDSQRCDFDGPRAFGMRAELLERRRGQTLHAKLRGII